MTFTVLIMIIPPSNNDECFDDINFQTRSMLLLFILLMPA
jgi:hypothetical protein